MIDGFVVHSATTVLIIVTTFSDGLAVGGGWCIDGVGPGDRGVGAG